MQDQYFGDLGARPVTGDDWLTRLTQYQYSSGGLGPLWGPYAGNAPGETRYVNPYSSQSPYYNSGIAGTGRSTDSPWSMGGAAGTPAAALAGGGASGGGAGGVGLGAASGVSTAPLLPSTSLGGMATASSVPGATMAASPSAWSSIGSFAASPLGGSLINTGLGAISNYFTGKAQAEAARADTAQRDRQQLINQILSQFNTQQQAEQRGGEVGLQSSQAAPLRQDWRQRQSLWADILPQLRNVSVSLPGSMQSYMPQISGGLRLPEGGLSQSALSQFSPAARQAAEQDLDRQTMVATRGQYASPDYAAYYGSGYAPATSAMNAYGSTLREQEAAPYTQQQLMLRDLLNRAISVNS